MIHVLSYSVGKLSKHDSLFCGEDQWQEYWCTSQS